MSGSEVVGARLADKSSDPGVPAALPRTLIRLRERVPIEDVDRIWIFPPVRSGRRESGLLAVSVYQHGEDRHGMITVAYQAEQTGAGTTVNPSFTMEGAATPDRFPRVMQGVVRRGGEEKGEPREVEIDGSAERFEELLAEFDEGFLEAGEP